MAFRLADITVAATLRMELQEVVSAATGLTTRAALRRLSERPPQTKLKTVFAREWQDAIVLGRMRVAFARDWGFADQIAAASGKTRLSVVRQLNKEAGQRLVGNAFPELLHMSEDDPRDDNAEPAGGDDSGETLTTERIEHLVGSLTVSDVRNDPTSIEIVATLLDLSETRVRRAIRNEHGARLIRNVFAGEWELIGTNDDPPTRGTSVRATSSADPLVVDGRWQVQSELGRGGFGVAYEVLDLMNPDHPTSVLKLSNGTVSSERLRQEMRLALQVHHQNVCAYRHIGVDPDHGAYIVMAHGGTSLDKHIARGDRFSIADACEIVRQAAAGIDHVHEHNILHQDIKPANVLVRKHNGRVHVQISDFGISLHGRQTRRTTGRETVMATMPYGYSPGYASPEQRAVLGVSKRSDQYSLALVFCSLLEHRVFSSPWQIRSFRRLSATQNHALRRALSIDPERRFESCGAFVRALLDG